MVVINNHSNNNNSLSFSYNSLNKVIYKKDLLDINNLKAILRGFRDYAAGNITGITRDEKIALNIIRLLLCKIYDEKNKKDDEIVDFAFRPNESALELSNRINYLYLTVKTKFNDIIDVNEELEFSPVDIAFIVNNLQHYKLLNSKRDIIADAFEELIGTAFRGGEGQFFTPRNIVQMMIDVTKPLPGERIIDPACGSGGFLAYILQYLQKNGNSDHYLAGIDKDTFLSKLTKIYLTLMGESEYYIFCENSLKNPKEWDRLTKKHIKLASFDLILTNPPFGSKIPVVGDDLLNQYKLGHVWKNNKGNWSVTDELRDKQPPQILFIERVIQLLKPGGRAGIILPEGIFGNPSDRYIWDYINSVASITGIVGLSQETFQPSTHTKTSVLFIEKKIKSRDKVFFGIARAIGHNKNGKALFKTNELGEYLFDDFGNAIIDDDTPDISSNFSAFLDGTPFEENHLGFIVPIDEIKQNIYIPETYKPEIKEKLNILKKSDSIELIKFGDFIDQGIIEMKRGNEIGSQFYGSGPIPFIRTTDIVNWEFKIENVKCVSEDVYKKYKKRQDIKVNDILFVNDGTFLIGRSSIVTDIDLKIIIQSHIRKIRVLNYKLLNPYYLFYLLNTNFVQDQIDAKTFVQATLSTLGNRLNEIILPFHKNEEDIIRISSEIEQIIKLKASLRSKSLDLIRSSI